MFAGTFWRIGKTFLCNTLLINFKLNWGGNCTICFLYDSWNCFRFHHESEVELFHFWSQWKKLEKFLIQFPWNETFLFRHFEHYECAREETIKGIFIVIMRARLFVRLEALFVKVFMMERIVKICIKRCSTNFSKEMRKLENLRWNNGESFEERSV